MFELHIFSLNERLMQQRRHTINQRYSVTMRQR